MTQETATQLRVRLGRTAMTLIDGSTEQPAIALDQHIERLQAEAAQLEEFKSLVAQHRDRDGRQSEALSKLAGALDRQSDTVSRLFNLVDFRTRELANLFLHISALVGTKFATGADLERLHRRLAEIAQDFEKDANIVSEFLTKLSRETERSSSDLTRSLEEQNLTTALHGDPDHVSLKKTQEFER